MDSKKNNSISLPLEVSLLEKEDMITSNEVFSFLTKRLSSNYNPNCFLYHGVRFDESLTKLENIFKERKILASKYIKNAFVYSDNANKGEYVSLLAFKDNGVEYDVFINENISLLISPLCNAYLTKYVPYHIWEKISNIETKNLYSYMKDEYLCKDSISFDQVKAIGFPYKYYLVKYGKEYSENRLAYLKQLMDKYGILLAIVDTSRYNSVLVEAKENINEKRNIK